MKKIVVALTAASFLLPGAAFAGSIRNGIDTDAYTESGTSASVTEINVESKMYKYNKMHVNGYEKGINVSVSAENLKAGIGGFGFDDANSLNQDSLAGAAAADNAELDVASDTEVTATDKNFPLTETVDVEVTTDTRVIANGAAGGILASNDSNGEESSHAGGIGIVADGSGSLTGTYFKNSYYGTLKEWGKVKTDVTSFVAEATAFDGYNAEASSFTEWD